MTPYELATALHQALMAGRHGEDIRHLFAEDAVTIEHPNALQPGGGRRGLEEVLAGSTAGAKLLSRQEYEVHQAIENEDEVVVRLTWTGEVREPAGPFAAGQRLRAHIVQFVRARDGRIREIETYDCYEPFVQGADDRVDEVEASDSDRVALVEKLYRAFNERDLDAVVDAMAPDVDWPNGWEGGRLVGRDSVREYWERQWLQIRPTTTLRKALARPDGSVEAHVRLVVRDPAGTVLSRSDVVHVYEFAGPQVQRMTIRP